MTLQNLQAELAEAILNNEFASELITPIQHLCIYQNNIYSKLLNALQTTYPMMVKLLGKDFFTLAAKEYIKHYPSCSGNLHDYGEYFSDFLAEYAPLKDLVYSSEVAQFEWICHQLNFAANPIAMDPFPLHDLAPEQYEQVHLLLHPASKVMRFYYPILRIIDLCQNEKMEELNIEDDGIHLLIIRRELEINLTPLTKDEFKFLDALQNNASLAQAIALATQADPAFNLDEKLSSWVKDKTIVNYEIH